MIDLDAVVALRAVALHGSVSSAASGLGFTPSAVSQQIKRLERDTRVELLERVGRGVVLTDAGRRLVDASAALLADLEQIETDLQHTAGVVTGEVRLAAFSTAVRGLISPVLSTLKATHPEVHVPLLESEPWDTVSLISSGQRDLGVVHRWGGVALAAPANVVATPLFTDVADVILRADHPLAGRSQLHPADLADEDWIGTPEATICRQWLRRVFDGIANAPRVVHESMEFSNHINLVQAGLGIALVPRLGREPLGPDLVAIPTVDPVSTRDIVALHRRSLNDSPALRAVLDALVVAAASKLG